MNLTERLVSRLPYLRRFARALTGSQAAGDAYVAATLETLAEDPDALRADDLSVALFGLFCRLWQTVDLNMSDDGGEISSAANADENLAALRPQERMVFLLRMLEGFSADQTAAILGISVRDVARLMDEANADIAAQLSSRILIIEDESITAMDLSSIVNALGHHVTSVAKTHGEAVEAVARERPGLILADIQLADGSSGVEAVNEIMTSFSVPAIFITGHPDLLLTGERPEPTFLISKPYDPESVKAMISQVLFFQTNRAGRAAA